MNLKISSWRVAHRHLKCRAGSCPQHRPTAPHFLQLGPRSPPCPLVLCRWTLFPQHWNWERSWQGGPPPLLPSSLGAHPYLLRHGLQTDWDSVCLVPETKTTYCRWDRMGMAHRPGRLPAAVAIYLRRAASSLLPPCHQVMLKMGIANSVHSRLSHACRRPSHLTSAELHGSRSCGCSQGWSFLLLPKPEGPGSPPEGVHRAGMPEHSH